MDPRKSYWFASKDIYEAFRLLNKEALTPTVFNIKDFRTEYETLDSVIQACWEGKCILSAVDKEASQDWSEEEVTDWHDKTQRPMKGDISTVAGPGRDYGFSSSDVGEYLQRSTGKAWMKDNMPKPDDWLTTALQTCHLRCMQFYSKS